jgi:hypothetical protein
VVEVFLKLVASHPELGAPLLEDPTLKDPHTLQPQLPWIEQGLLKPA